MTILLFSGIPATGKSTLGRVLSEKCKLVYFDMENPNDWPYPCLHSVWNRSRSGFVTELNQLSKSVVLDWGFPPQFLQWVLELRSCGVRLVWFEGNIEIARQHFRERNRLHRRDPEYNMENYEKQVNAIKAEGLPGNHGFKIVQAFDNSGSVLALKDPERLIQSILSDE